MTRRVVVTGVGLVCALGIGTEESWKNLIAGKSGVGRITHFDTTGFDCQIAGEVKNFDPFQWIEKKELKKMGRFIQIALAGADFAVFHSFRDCQSGFRTHFHSLRRARTKFRDRHGLFRFGTRHR